MNKIWYLLIALSFVIGITLGSSTNVIGQQASIPSWVKNTALWWGQGQISDADFVKALQWMINQGILTMPSNTSSNNNLQASNPLNKFLPSSSDIGAFWNISSVTSSSRFGILQQATPPLTPKYTIEQSLEKSSDTPPSMIIIDVASFQAGGGISLAYQTQATSAYQFLVANFESQNSGFSKVSFSPDKPDPTESCYIYSLSKTESTQLDMFCVKGAMIFTIQASGNSFNLLDNVKMLANLMLPKIQSYLNT